MNESIYERIGGEESINLAVDIFYKKVLSDIRIKHFFEDVNMEKLGTMQKEFLTFAFGGPNKYTGEIPKKCTRQASRSRVK